MNISILTEWQEISLNNFYYAEKSTSKFRKINKNKSRSKINSMKISIERENVPPYTDYTSSKMTLFGERNNNYSLRNKNPKKSKIMSLVEEYTTETAALKESWWNSWYRDEKRNESIADTDYNAYTRSSSRKQNYLTKQNSTITHSDRSHNYSNIDPRITK